MSCQSLARFLGKGVLNTQAACLRRLAFRGCSQYDETPPLVSVKRPKIYRKYSDGFVVREMTAHDVSLVQSWYRFNMGITSVFDMPLILDICNAPGALYMGEYKGVPVSSCVRVPWADNKLYGSMLYVAKEYRKYGFAARMRDEVAAEYIGSNMLVVDAVIDVSPGYLKNKGYIKQFMTGRYHGKASSVRARNIPAGVRLVQAKEVSMQDIIDYDNKYFCSQNFPIRREFLRQWRFNEYASFLVARDSNDKVVGFGLRKVALQVAEHAIGPIYADSPEIGEFIFEGLCKDVAEDGITIDVWKKNDDTMKMLKNFNFEEVFEVSHMSQNGDSNDYKPQVISPTSIEICGF